MLFANMIAMIDRVGTAIQRYLPYGLAGLQHSYGPRTAAALTDGIQVRLVQVEADTRAFANALDAVSQQRRIGRLHKETKLLLGQAAESAAIGAAELAALLHELVPQLEIVTLVELDNTEYMDMVEFGDVSEIEQVLHRARQSLEHVRAARRLLLPESD